MDKLYFTDLKVMNLRAPLGVDTPKPFFSWTAASDGQNKKQTAYQVLVSADGKTFDMWDSGEVESDKVSFIEYGGKPLSSCTKYFWKVRIKDEQGSWSDYSDVSPFETAFLDQREFEGEWIAASEPKDKTWFYVWDDHGIELDMEQTINPKLNHIWRSEGSLYGKSLGFMPYWRLDYNKQRRSALSPIKALIDDYDVMECGLSNNLKDMDTPIMLVRGYDGSDFDELQQNLKTKKIVGVDDDGGIEMKTVDIPYEARKIKADEDEKNIYRFGMGLNASQVGDGNITNIVIKSRYALLDLKSKKIIRRAKKFLKPIIKVVLDEINEANKTAYQYSDVWIEFDPVIPTNELEKAQIALTEAQTRSVEINTIKTIALDIGDEQKLRLICDELEISFNDVKAILEETNDLQNLLGADNILQALEVNDDE